MPSFVWDREPSEAYAEPYEYEGQAQFSREASAVLARLGDHYSQSNRRFGRDERTPQKAVWMLQVDALGSLMDSLDLIVEKRHRLVSRLFRDAVETMDASLYFALGGTKADATLEKWYEDKVVSHRVFREFIKQHHGDAKFEHLRAVYSDFSRYTHRSYRALLMSYMLAGDEKISYDGFRPGVGGVLPHVISFSYAVIAMLIKRFVEFSIATGQLDIALADTIWKDCLEPETVRRRFGYGVGQLRRGPEIEISLDEL